MVKEQELESKFSYLLCRTEADTQKQGLCITAVLWYTRQYPGHKCKQFLNQQKNKCRWHMHTAVQVTITMDGPSHLRQNFNKAFPEEQTWNWYQASYRIQSPALTFWHQLHWCSWLLMWLQLMTEAHLARMRFTVRKDCQTLKLSI